MMLVFTTLVTETLICELLFLPTVVLLTTSCCCVCVCLTPPLSSVVVTEPAAAEGQFHGGAGGGSEEAAACLPFHRPAALRQTEETDRRVRNTTGFMSRCLQVEVTAAVKYSKTHRLSS